MTTIVDDIVRPTKQRLASEYNDVKRATLDYSQYPCTIASISHPTQDLAYVQSILGHANNFAEQTVCDAFEVGVDGIGHMRVRILGS